MYKKKLLLTLALLLLTSISVLAQNQVKGTVTDSKGEPM